MPAPSTRLFGGWLAGIATLITACSTVTPITMVDAGLGMVDAGPGIPPEEGAVTASCSPDGWCWENPVPQGNELRAAWAVAPTDAWFVGTGGTVLHWDGAAWTVMHAPTDDDLDVVWASSATDVWVRGPSAPLRHWDGASWTTAEHDGATVWGSGPSDVWVVGPAVWHFDGRGWAATTLPPGTAGASAVSGSGPHDVWITPGYDGSGQADLRLFHWDGTRMETFTRPADPRAPCSCDDLVRQVWSVSRDDAWLAGSNHIWHWDGTAFNEVPPPLDTRAGTWWTGRIWGTGADDVWVLGEYLAGTAMQQWAIFRWDGSTWSISTAPLGMSGLVGTGPADAWLVGSAGRVAHWNGGAWTLALPRSIVPSAPDMFVDAWTDGETIRAVGETTITGTSRLTSALWRFDGDAWNIEDIGASDVAFVAGTAADDVWAATRDAIFHFDGADWSRSPSDVDLSSGISALWARARDDAWAATLSMSGSGPSVVHWDGSRWSAWSAFVSSTTNARITSFGGAAADDLWIANVHYYPEAAADVLHWDGITLTPNATGFSGWRTPIPRIGILANARGDAWIAGCTYVVHMGSTVGDGAVFSPTGTGTGSGCVYDPEIVLGREPSGRIWATRSRGAMMTFDGTSWAKSDTAAAVGLHGLVSDSTNVMRALGDGAAILRHDP